MLNRTRFAMALALLVSGGALADPSLETLWNARGLEGVDEAKALGNPAPKSVEYYRKMIELAFATHLNPAPNGEFAFTLILKAGRDGELRLKHRYLGGLYSGYQICLALEVESLPKGWSVRIAKASVDDEKLVALARERVGIWSERQTDLVEISAPGASLFFDMNDPFNPVVVARLTAEDVKAMLAKPVTPEQSADAAGGR